MRTKRILLAASAVGVVLALGLSLRTFETIGVPLWRIRVVTESGSPVQHALVREIWKNYSLETEGHEQDARSDEEGYVEFPVRRVRASTIERAWGPLHSLLQQGAHAGFGNDAYVLAFTEGAEGFADYKAGIHPPDVVIVRPRVN